MFRRREQEGQARLLLPRLRAEDEAYFREFTYVDLCHYGAEGDSGIFLRSDLLKALSEDFCGVPSPTTLGSAGVIPYVIVGDEAFPLKTFLMRPYARRELQKHRLSPSGPEDYQQRATFNNRLSRARRVIENLFRIMAARWRILRRPFRASEETTENICKACVVLHNFMMSESALARSAYSPPGYADSEDWQENETPGLWRTDGNDLPAMRGISRQGSARSAMDVRDRLAQYFVTEGKVPWQGRMKLASTYREGGPPAGASLDSLEKKKHKNK
ncbi:uncharacterized protein [Dermacentor albipictus]|uniref:uncharacterized protein n=1 Tax=Dermacentor albipictus TaxID=60249 RepID=UPI0038FC95FF